MLEVAFPAISYGAWLLIVTAIVAMYVVTGGLKAVMYTDAFQGSIMAIMMLILVITTYSLLGGVTEAHQALTDMVNLVPAKLIKGGMTGWTVGPHLDSPIGLTVYTTIIYGVGIRRPGPAAARHPLHDRALGPRTEPGCLPSAASSSCSSPAWPLWSVRCRTSSSTRSSARYPSPWRAAISTRSSRSTSTRSCPGWFSGLFLVAMFAAAMSTMSSQYHVGGTSLSRDFLEQYIKVGNSGSDMKLNRLGVTVAVIATLIWAWLLPGGVIARATAFFFGLCAASFLPIYVLGLYWKGMTKIGAKISMVGGFAFSMFWLLFIHVKEAAYIGLCQAVFGKATLVADAAPGSWMWLMQWVDPNVVALPVSLVLAVTISLATRRMEQKHLDLCWDGLC